MFGIDVHRYAETLPAVRARILTELGVDLVLDVGANQGQYAHELRSTGYGGRIISFEPLPDAFSALTASLGPDPLWEGIAAALGDEDGEIEIHESANSVCSSILDTSDTLLATSPGAIYVGSRMTALARLDSIANDILRADDDVYLKMDVQGYELPALKGAVQTLRQVVAIEVELSLVPLYERQALVHEVMGYLSERGFEPVWLEKVLVDSHSGHLLQVDGLFVRRP
jgi:FkbM family methyltransferase